MAYCEKCGKEFDPSEAEVIFESNEPLTYANFKKCVCGECAVDVIESEDDGYYFETCEKCGREFDLIEDMSTFDSHFPWYNGTDLMDHWDSLILCAECAIEKIEDEAE